MTTTDTEQTPVEVHEGVLVKRDDLFVLDGQRGGKVRTCVKLAMFGVLKHRTSGRSGQPGLVTAGSRHSPQVAIVASVARSMDLPCRVHVPDGDDTPETAWAMSRGAQVVRHRPGHNSVIKARARTDAEANDWIHIPFGMEDIEAVRQTSGQVASLCEVQEWERLVVPVGSGMTLAGILKGFEVRGEERKVLGVVTGADPVNRLDRYAPVFWRDMVTLVPALVPYGQHVPGARLGDLPLDPVYEAKTLNFLTEWDALWVVGRRGSDVD
jgi:1-aminocyclopropane-1-carboxylate deaminase/D-cysteine desulfhydrase-like pyridoxal-dependent ACC family enzyme